MRNAISIFVICSCAVTAGAREELRRDFQKTAALAAGRTFRIEHSLGNVTIRTHNRNEVSIHATIRCSASNADRAKQCADRIQISVQESASGVSVRTEYPRYEGNNNISYGADYEIVMPENSPLELRNRFGAVDAVGVRAGTHINNGNGRVTFAQGKGALRIENSFGDVDLRENDGDATVVNANGRLWARNVTGALSLSDRFGEIEVTDVGRNLTVHSANGRVSVSRVGGLAIITNSFGDVTVNDAKADVSVRNENGGVNVSGVSGAAELQTTFGNIKFTRIGKTLTARGSNGNVMGDTVGESATVETTFGKVDLRGIKGGARVTTGNTSIQLAGISGTVYAKASFGGVTVEDASGPIAVESENGSVTVRSNTPACQPISVNASFAPVKVTLPPSVGYNLSARTSFGRIHSSVTTNVSDISSDELTGKIGSGGCELRLVNHNGNIDILSAAAR